MDISLYNHWTTWVDGYPWGSCSFLTYICDTSQSCWYMVRSLNTTTACWAITDQCHTVHHIFVPPSNRSSYESKNSSACDVTEEIPVSTNQQGSYVMWLPTSPVLGNLCSGLAPPLYPLWRNMSQIHNGPRTCRSTSVSDVTLAISYNRIQSMQSDHLQAYTINGQYSQAVSQ